MVKIVGPFHFEDNSIKEINAFLLWEWRVSHYHPKYFFMNLKTLLLLGELFGRPDRRIRGYVNKYATINMSYRDATVKCIVRRAAPDGVVVASSAWWREMYQFDLADPMIPVFENGAMK